MTLIEVLLAVAMSGFIAMALSRAVEGMVRYEQQAPQSSKREQARIDFETRMREMISAAYLSADETSTTTYFIATSSQGSSQYPDTLQFTVLSPGVSGAYLGDSADLPDLNKRYGPQGGMEEVAISTTPVGDAGDRQGLFLREQRPPDGDPTQGGTESVLDPDVTSAYFEFYTGESWSTTWNTQTADRRLPAAVRVTYRLSDEDEDRVLIVRLLHSDVTADNPVYQGATL